MEYIENNSDTLSPELSCSFTGTSSISFALANYLSSTPPVWVTIDANSGVLNISPPDIASDTIYEFYIDSTIAGVSGPVHKLIRLTIKNWIVSNWQQCISTSITTCANWNSGYSLNSGAWMFQTPPPLVPPTPQATSSTSSSSSQTSGSSTTSSTSNTSSNSKSNTKIIPFIKNNTLCL